MGNVHIKYSLARWDEICRGEIMGGRWETATPEKQRNKGIHDVFRGGGVGERAKATR